MTELLSVSGLTRRFGSLTAVDRLDLRLDEGARHALIGPNGAGKTTVLHLVAGTIRPTAGRISLAGRDITGRGPARRARLGLARTFQTPALCESLSGLENVLIGAGRHARPASARRRPWRRRPSGRRERTLQALRQLDALGIGHLAAAPAGQLAHGQRRLLELAVALAAQPRLLLLDEPAAGLTDTDLPLLLAALHGLPDWVSVLLVEHHMDVVAAVASQVTVLHQGQVLAQGSPTAVATDPAVADIYLGAGAGAGPGAGPGAGAGQGVV